jgi:hypothetical protein
MTKLKQLKREVSHEKELGGGDQDQGQRINPLSSSSSSVVFSNSLKKDSKLRSTAKIKYGKSAQEEEDGKTHIYIYIKLR